MNTTKEELQERAQLVRIHEANCRIEYPSKDEANFRLALTMSGGSYATFLDTASVVVLGSVLGLLLLVQALAWLFGYRKSFTDEAERV